MSEREIATSEEVGIEWQAGGYERTDGRQEKMRSITELLKAREGRQGGGKE